MNFRQQPLFHALSKPLCYWGLSVDEWGIVVIGSLIGLLIMNSGSLFYDLAVMGLSVFACSSLRNYKKIGGHFLLRSVLTAKGILAPPSANYPQELGQRLGR